MTDRKKSAVSPGAVGPSEVSAVPFPEIKLRIIGELASCEGILLVFTEPGDEENSMFIIMDREDFDDELEGQVYALQERLMREFGVPLSFVCLPRIALQEGVPSPLAEVLVNNAV